MSHWGRHCDMWPRNPFPEWFVDPAVGSTDWSASSTISPFKIASAAESHLLQGHASLFLNCPLPKSLIPVKAERLGPLSLIQDSSWRAILVQLFPVHWVKGVMGLCYLDPFLLNIGSSHILIIMSLSTFWMSSQDTITGPTVFWPEVSLL